MLNALPRQLTHLERLEAESIHIMREVVAEAEKPVMLYSIGKDIGGDAAPGEEGVLPGAAAFPAAARRYDLEVPRHVRAARQGRGESRHRADRLHATPRRESAASTRSTTAPLHTDMWKTEGLKQALDKYGFDAAFGGARRDEEKSRAKERIFSFRSANHRWDPKNQRPELWNALQRPQGQGREHPRLPALQLDRARRLAIHPCSRTSPIVPLYFAARAARRSSATACS